MAVEWVVNYDCQAKQELDTEGILGALRARGQAEAIIEVIRRDEPDKPIEDMTAQHRAFTPEGVTTKEVRVADLLQQAKSLEPHEAACEECPGNVLGHPFGCFGEISYPFTAEGERWLLDQLPESVDTLVGVFLKGAKEDLEWDGAPYAALRRQGDGFFELKRAPVKKWGRVLGRFVVSADELYYAMFPAEIQPVHAAMLCVFVGAIGGEKLPRFLNSLDTRALPDFQFDPDAEDERTTSQLQMYFEGLYTAARLGVTVSIDQ